ncbi:hypothetical protein K501DRAFT_333816 [Backusella circina FSU 941]|nr:hypothetical protein K501DRAFT_333816 [Backusella circina FSU 941]
MNPVHLTNNLVHQHREKRLKVSKACYTCRVKKIKCKARRRPCSFSKDGVENQTQISPDNRPVPPSNEDERPAKQRRLTPPSVASPFIHEETIVPTISFQLDTRIAEQRVQEQNTLRKVSQQLDKLSMMWPGEGKEDGTWVVDIDLLFRREPIAPPSTQTFPEKINPNLLNLYFRYRYTLFPILPKTTFYRLLERRDPFITPLLLYSIYCNAAHFSNDEATDASMYFRKAQDLLDAHLDTPTLSTIVALCLMSIYEPNRYSIGPHASKSKRRLYCDMALRMCYDLNLHRRSQDESATLEDIELRKRVYWICYCQDKVESLTSGRPVLLYSRDIEIDFPIVLRSDDTTEYEITICLVEHIKLMQLAERVLQLDFPDRRHIISTPQNEQMAIELEKQLQYWLRNLPSHMQWTPLATDRDNNVPTQPPANALAAHLHLVYNITELHVLQPYSSVFHPRCANVATNITQLTCAMADQPNFILSFSLIADGIISAVRTHIMSCADEKLNTARHARFMFQRSLRSLRSILHHRVNDTIEYFASSLEEVLTSADNGNSRSSSPKLHVLSPIIPRNSTSSSFQESLNPFTNEDRWTNTNSNNVTMIRNSNLYSYGLVSPASSTASAPLDKNVITNTREDEFARPITTTSSLTNTAYANSNQSPINPVVSNDAFTTTRTNTGFTVPPTSTHAWKSNNIVSIQQHQMVQPQGQEERQPQQETQDIYTSVWGTRSDTIFSTDMMDSSFVDTKQGQVSKEEDRGIHQSFTLDNNNNYALWNSNNKKDQEEEKTSIIIPPQQRYGLGVYASAQQHHTDVIRQHIPELKSSHPSVRPVLLTHHGQVVVAAGSQNDVA